MTTSPETPSSEPSPPRRLGNLIPTFAQPRPAPQDPPLPGTPAPPSTATTDPAATGPTEMPGLNRPAPTVLSADPDTSRPTATSGTDDRPRLKPSGDPRQVAKVIGGLLLIVTGALGLLTVRRSGGTKEFRQPTPDERDDIARPLARIAVRHFPLDLIGEDLADVTEAIVAGHEYVMAGPLTYPTEQPNVLGPDDTEDVNS